MEKRNFEIIARAFATCANGATKATIASQIADALERTNPRFDRFKFLHACGVR